MKDAMRSEIKPAEGMARKDDVPGKIDNRPMWLILLDRTARYQVMAGVAVVMAILLRLSPPEGLSVDGYRSLVLFGATIFFWISGLLPIAVTALLSMVMLPLLGHHGRQEDLLHVRQRGGILHPRRLHPGRGDDRNRDLRPPGPRHAGQVREDADAASRSPSFSSPPSSPSS